MDDEPTTENDFPTDSPVRVAVEVNVFKEYPVQEIAVENSPEKFGQFRITTLLSWTTIVCLVFATARPTFYSGAGWGDLLSQIVAYALLVGPPWAAVPTLVDQVLKKQNGLHLHLFWRIWMTLFVGIYSIFNLMLATVGFSPEWKGSKGMHWLYYVLDGWAGLTLWPIFFVGAVLFIVSLHSPQKPRTSILHFLGPATCAFICYWYVLAVLFLDFSGGEQLFAMVPGGCGVCYGLYAIIIWREREFEGAGNFFNAVKAESLRFWYWMVSLVLLMMVKIPLSIQMYNDLPDDPPQACFVVTAATRGHRGWVGTWYDPDRQRWVNRQLLTFWEFENRLQNRCPQIHQWLRKIYNRVGPAVARRIVFRWQADCVYVLLKPLEWLARIL